MATPVDPAAKKEVESITGPGGAGLQMRLFKNDTAPVAGSPASGLQEPTDAWYRATQFANQSIYEAAAARHITARSPGQEFTLPATAEPSQPVTGWAVTSTVFGEEVILFAEKFPQPVQLTREAPTLRLQPTLSFVPAPSPSGGTIYAVGGTALPVRRKRMRRQAFTGTRRGQVQRLIETLDSLGLWDGKEAKRAGRLGVDAVYFSTDPDVQLAMQTLYARAQAALLEVR